jgi:nucleotide-binding universal stress UspA family protein
MLVEFGTISDGSLWPAGYPDGGDERRRKARGGNKNTREAKRMGTKKEFGEEVEKVLAVAKGGKTMRIMVPVDGTPECEEAVPMAARLAEGLGADVYLVRAVEAIDAFSPLRHEPEIAAMVKETRAYLHDLAYRWELPTEQTQCLATHTDNAAKELIELGKANEIDLIVMATHGKKGFQRWVQGSVTDEVIRAKVCPVITVPAAGAPAVGGRHARWYERLPVPGRGAPARTQGAGELAKR